MVAKLIIKEVVYAHNDLTPYSLYICCATGDQRVHLCLISNSKPGTPFIQILCNAQNCALIIFSIIHTKKKKKKHFHCTPALAICS